mmetsp:Transcript_103513/g.316908  ORF Transcript_103513/g.316908 Transcript_103513/m.316908 type:complete len:226 (-) Transcript_103513:63-740(-)
MVTEGERQGPQRGPHADFDGLAEARADAFAYGLDVVPGEVCCRGQEHHAQHRHRPKDDQPVVGQGPARDLAEVPQIARTQHDRGEAELDPRPVGRSEGLVGERGDQVAQGHPIGDEDAEVHQVARDGDDIVATAAPDCGARLLVAECPALDAEIHEQAHRGLGKQAAHEQAAHAAQPSAHLEAVGPPEQTTSNDQRREVEHRAGDAGRAAADSGRGRAIALDEAA